MTTLVWTTLVLVTLVSLGVTVCCQRWRRRLSMESARMSAMTLGMAGGLNVGACASALTADPFSATWIGGGIGMILGAFPAVASSPMATLEGILSGLMGGMMGAMTHDMLPPERTDTFLKLVFTLFACVTVLLMAFMAEEARPRFFSLFRRPFLLSGVLLLLLLAYVRLDSPLSLAARNDHPRPLRFEIVAVDFAYRPKTLSVPSGQPVTLSLVNRGAVEHDLHLAGFRAKPHGDGSPRSHAQHGAETSAWHLHAKPGETATMTFIPLERGTHAFACTLPGHAEQGMTGTLIVQ